MAFERSLRHLTGKNILNSHSAGELAQLAKDYPYFAPAQFLLTAQLKNTGDDFAYTTQLQKASLYSSNPLWLQYQLANLTNEEAGTSTTEDYTGSFGTPEPAAIDYIPATDNRSSIEIPTLETAIALAQYHEEAPAAEEHTPIVFEPYPFMPEPDTTATEAAVTPAPAEETFEYASILTTVEEEEITAAPEEEQQYTPIVFDPYPFMPEPEAATTIIPAAEEKEETIEAAPLLPTEEPYTFFFAEKEQEETTEDNNVVFLSEQYSHIYGQESAEEDTEEMPGTEEEDIIAAQKISSVLNNQLADFHKPVEEDAKFAFEAEPSHLVDYFASQGIKIDLTTEPQDKLTSHLRSFTSWLKKMKRPEIQDLDTDPRLENAVQDIARTSIESREVVTETMADVFIKQGQIDKAIQLYIKLSFLDPDKTVYFANKIQQLKVVLACVALGFIVLVQNPKGGGLSGNVGGLSNQFMGVKQTTDVLEKGTWLFAGIIAILAITSSVFLKSAGTNNVDNSLMQKVNTTNTAPAPTQSTPPNTVPASAPKKP
ncbi:hypothetical protein F5148DRAFT_1291110 [Russula earlei]|uniref:Uncharacterized protein n=1 Tax=Russula earlei TaxID=71964 RepID=A0ACC0TVX9_9AGAM|nr:hypothetical protein F5148DRAFT_1291110 [Russula earlei]